MELSSKVKDLLIATMEQWADETLPGRPAILGPAVFMAIERTIIEETEKIIKAQMSDDIKKAAEHIIALCDRLNVSDSDESRRVAGAYLALREQVEKIKVVADEWSKHSRINAFDAMHQITAAIKAIEEGQG